MKKIIAFMLCFMFSFGTISTIQKPKEVNAIGITTGLYALYFGAGVGFTAFMTYAQWFYANGYHIPINNLAVKFANDYYDYSNGVYYEKSDKMNVLEKLNLATSSFLSGNDPLTLSQLNEIKSMLTEELDQFVNTENLDVFQTIVASNQYPIYTNFFESSGLYTVVRPEFDGKILKLLYSETFPDYYVFLKLSAVDFTTQYYKYPIMQLIHPNGTTENLPFYTVLRATIDNINGFINIDTYNSINSILATSNNIYNKNYEGNTEQTINVTAGTYATGEHDFVFSYPNYYPALNGRAVTVDDLENLINVDEQLQLDILDKLQEQEVNQENEQVLPSIGADGNLWFGEDSSTPDVPYSPTESWFNDLMGWAIGMPEAIAQKVADIPILRDLVNVGQGITQKLVDIWDWLQLGLLGILESILEAILGIPISIINLLKDAMIWLFVPDPNFIGDKIDIFTSNFTFIESFTSIVSNLENMTGANSVPTVSADLSAFEGTFNGQQITMGNQAYVLDMRFYAPFKRMGDIMITAFVYMMFIWRFFGRIPDLIAGGGMLYTANDKTSELQSKITERRMK